MDVPAPEQAAALQPRRVVRYRVEMGLQLTSALLAATLLLAAFAGWRGARPPDFRRGPRLIPWRFVMLLAASFALVLLVHLVNLLGVQTGR